MDSMTPEIDPTILASARLVAADRNQGLDSTEEMTLRDAVEEARNVISLPEEGFIVGAYPLEEDGSVLAESYRRILELSPEQVAEIPNSEVVR